MSRYLILVLINIPLISLALINVLVGYKMGRFGRKKFLINLFFWIFILAALGSTQFIYEFLFSNRLTESEPLSLFDVIQITGIITILFIANQSRMRIEALEKKIQELHHELSIKLSDQPPTKK